MTFHDNALFFSIKTYVVALLQNCLIEAVLEKGHNICFYGEIKKTSRNYHQKTHASQSSDVIIVSVKVAEADKDE